MIMDIAYNDYIKTEEWRQRAEAAKARAGQRCQICNRPAPRVTLTVHHRTFERLGQEQPEDLTVLCRGCYELYEKNRRMPSPSAVAAGAAVPKTDKVTKRKRPSLEPAPLPRLFAPARENQQRAKLNGHNGHNGHNGQHEQQGELLLSLPMDTIYLLETNTKATKALRRFTLSPLAENSPIAALYQLAGAEEEKPVAQPAPAPEQPPSSRSWALIMLVGVTLLLVFGFSDFAPRLPALLSQRSMTNPVAATATNGTLLPVATPTVVKLVLPPTQTQSVAAPMTPTMMPTATPLPPTPTAPPPTIAPTPTSAPPTVEPIPQSRVARTALVCQNPCSCAPIVRTIAQGTAVTVRQTQACGGDTWYQIADNEWLGPGLVVTK